MSIENLPTAASTPLSKSSTDVTPSIPSKPVDKEEELKLIKPFLDVSLKEDDIYYVLDAKWWKKWKAYVGYEAKNDFIMNIHSEQATSDTNEIPGPIDNSFLQLSSENTTQLKANILENNDFIYILSTAWQHLVKWYSGGPEFPRRVIKVGSTHAPMLRIELYPPLLQLIFSDKDGNPDDSTKVKQPFSSVETLNDVAKFISSKKGQPVRLWMIPYSDSTMDTKPKEYRQCDEIDMTLTLAELDQKDDYILVEVAINGSFPRQIKQREWNDFQVFDLVDALDTQNTWYLSIIKEVDKEKGVLVHYLNWATRWDAWIPPTQFDTTISKKGTHCRLPHKSKPDSYSFVSGYSGFSGYSGWSGWGGWANNSEGTPIAPGAVGLRNLGNTCFMNSTIQCLSHTPLLNEYFVQGKYKTEINTDNPLGWKGKIAEKWGELMLELWGNKYTTVAPTSFKQAIGEFAPRFSGFQQQDSSELLSFLLDGLHEDLNRVKKKPMTSPVESNGRPDYVVAKEAWDVYLLRNQSIIVDLMQGQFKSKVTCPQCNRVSVTFDPFMFLSIPVPTDNDKNQIVTLLTWNDSKISVMAYAPKVPKYGAISDLKKELSKLCDISPKSMLIADVFNSRIHSLLEDHSSIGDITARDDIWSFIFPEVEKIDRKNVRYVRVSNRRSVKSHFYSGFMSIGGGSDYHDELFGLPLVLVLSAENPILCKDVHKRIVEMIKPFMTENASELPFKILIGDQSGRFCGKCETSYFSSSSCSGCELPNDDTVVNEADLNKISFIVQWKDSELYNEGIIKEPLRHSSCSNIMSELPRSSNPWEFERRSSLYTNTTFSLKDCLDSFASEDVLSEEDAWYCSKCKKHQCAAKQMLLYTMPEILVVHLKRFQYTRMSRDKIGCLVDFPIVGLDMSNWVVSEAEIPCIYDLYAVSNHMGSLGGGHYTAYVKGLNEDEKWYLCDDSSVSVADTSHIVSASAYVLFYRRRKSPQDKIHEEAANAALQLAEK